MSALIIIVVFLTAYVCALSMNTDYVLWPAEREWVNLPLIADNSSYTCDRPGFFPADYLCCQGARCSTFYMNPMHPWVIRRAEMRFQNIRELSNVHDNFYRHEEPGNWRHLGMTAAPLFKMSEIDTVHIRKVSNHKPAGPRDHLLYTLVRRDGDVTDNIRLLNDIADLYLLKAACVPHPCGSWSTCVTSDNKYGYVCICARHYGGRTCHQLMWLD